MEKPIRSTTIIGVRHKGQVAMAGDGQVTFGDMSFKQKAIKVREFKFSGTKVLGGFAGAAADALTLFEKFEQKLEQYEGDITRATVELAKDWRMDKMLRHLDAMLVVMSDKNSFIIAGDGNVIEPDGQVVAIGSGGVYGKGYGNGAQSHLDFIPESNTDFILAVLAEEFGLLGVLFLISLYLPILEKSVLESLLELPISLILTSLGGVLFSKKL